MENQPSLVIFDARQEHADGIIKQIIISGINVRINKAGGKEELDFLFSQGKPLAVLVCSTDEPSWWSEIGDAVRKQQIPILAWLPTLDESALTAALRTPGLTVQCLTHIDSLTAALDKLSAQSGNLDALQAARRSAVESTALADHLFESDHRALALVHEGLHVRVNPAYRQLLGFDAKEDLAAHSILEFFRSQDPETLRNALRRLSRPEEQSIGLSVITGPESQPTEYDMQLLPVQHQGEACALVMLVPYSAGERAGQAVVGPDGPQTFAHRLVSRLAFFEAVQSGLSEADRATGCVALVCLRPDNFESALRMLGHAASESYLSDLETIIERSLDEGELACRFSGHEFLLYMNSGYPNDPFEAVEQLRQTCSEHSVQFQDSAVALGCSAGMASLFTTGSGLDELIDKARQSCAQAEVCGNRLLRYRPNLEITRPEQANGSWGERLEQAIAGGHFYSLQQAIAHLDGEGEAMLDSQVYLREAAGDLSPEAWHQAAHACQLGSRIDRLTLPGQLAALTATSTPATGIVRISKESLSDPGFPAWLAAQMAEHGLPGSRLILQAHCADVLDRARAAYALVSELAPLGCRLALSGLEENLPPQSLLTTLRISLARLSGHWISEVRKDSNQLRQTQELVERLQNAGIDVVGDGIRSAADLSLAWQAGIRRLSGEFLIEHDQSSQRQAS